MLCISAIAIANSAPVFVGRRLGCSTLSGLWLPERLRAGPIWDCRRSNESNSLSRATMPLPCIGVSTCSTSCCTSGTRFCEQQDEFSNSSSAERHENMRGIILIHGSLYKGYEVPRHMRGCLLSYRLQILLLTVLHWSRVCNAATCSSGAAPSFDSCLASKLEKGARSSFIAARRASLCAFSRSASLNDAVRLMENDDSCSDCESLVPFASATLSARILSASSISTLRDCRCSLARSYSARA